MDSKKLSIAIDALNRKGNRNFANVFEDFIDLALFLLCNNPDENQIKLWNMVNENKDFKKGFEAAMLEYGKACEGFQDPLGEIYMDRISSGELGQYFTPIHITDFMAEIAGVKNDSVSDPTCGSGRMLLSALKVARREEKEPFLYGNDLCPLCAKMTLLNILVNTARGEVSCGDTMQQGYDGYKFYHIDRVMIGNVWVSSYWQFTTQDVDKVNAQRKEWANKVLEYGGMVEGQQNMTYICPDKSQAITTEKPAADVLVAKPKAKAVQLDLFEEF